MKTNFQKMMVIALILMAKAFGSKLLSNDMENDLAKVFHAANWKSQLRIDLQRQIDTRYMKIQQHGIHESNLFSGNVYKATNSTEFNSFSGKLKPGDKLLLVSGDWIDSNLKFEGSGTKENPILICPDKPKGVVFKGKSNAIFSGTNIIVHDLEFRNVEPTAQNNVIFRIGNGESKPADSCIFHQIRFLNCGSSNPNHWSSQKIWLMSACGLDNTVANCTFDGFHHIGQMISAAKLPTNGLQRLHIINNKFANRPHLDNQNGYEIIQIGWSGVRGASSGSLIMGNTFEKCDGENELITLKASDIVLKNNRVIGCQGVFCLRTASRVLVQENIFDGQGRPNTGGIRIQGSDHVIFRNSFRNLGLPENYYYWPISLMASNLEQFHNSADPGGYSRSKNILIANNSFENCKKGIAVGIYPRKEYPLLPKNIHAWENSFQGMQINNPFDYMAPDPSGKLMEELKESNNKFLP